MEWMDAVKLNPTPSPKLDEVYQIRHDDEEVECNTHHRQMHEDLIWLTSLQMEEYNLN
jgi:hypothetical protein